VVLIASPDVVDKRKLFFARREMNPGLSVIQLYHSRYSTCAPLAHVELCAVPIRKMEHKNRGDIPYARN
jgi:hypothetical protein